VIGWVFETQTNKQINKQAVLAGLRKNPRKRTLRKRTHLEAP